MRPVTRRMDEMTSREVERYLQAGGDTVFVPFGPVSGHGALLPMGVHGHWAHAVSLLLADRVNGLVFPPVYACYAGATRTFRGTVSFPIAEQAAILVRLAQALHGQGFRKTVLVAGTQPEDLAGAVAARELFDRSEAPFWMIVCARLLEHPEAKAIIAGYPGNFGETLIDAASLRILGRERPLPCAAWAKEPKPDGGGDQPEEVFRDVVTLRTLGVVGWRYHEESHHGNHGTAGMEFRGASDIDLAVRVLEKCADLLVPAVQALERYAGWLQAHPFRYIEPTDRLNER